MTTYEQLLEAEARKEVHTVEICEISTSKGGVANTMGNNVAVFYGAEDGSDDAVISPDEFNLRFEITAILPELHWHLVC